MAETPEASTSTAPVATRTVLPFPAPDALDMQSSGLADRWKEWEQAWTFYSDAIQLDKEEERRCVSTLMTVIGSEARKVYSNFQWTDPGDKYKIEPVLQQFRDYCSPHKQVPFERYRFNKRQQQPGETYNQYRTDLQHLAAGCDFETITPDEILRDRLVFGIADNKLRERLLREPKLTLAKTDALCRASEATQQQMKAMSTEASTNAVSKRRVPERHKRQGHKSDFQQSKPRTACPRRTQNSSAHKPTTSSRDTSACGNCGRKHPADKTACPAHGQTCRNCAKRGHFAKMCRSARHVQNYIHAEDLDSSDVEIIHSVNDTPKTKALVTLTVNNKDRVSFQLDTGASVNILPFDDYVQVTGDKACTSLQRTSTRLIMHNKAEVKPRGQAWLTVERNGTTHKLKFIVVQSKVMPLLSLQSCLDMNLVQILDCDTLHTVTQEPAEMPDQKPPVTPSRQTALSRKVKEDHVLRQYPDVLEGLGTLPGEYHIQVDPAVPPVVHAPRKVPVALKETVKGELTRMVGDGIIAPVTEPTQWVSSMVVARKKNGSVRICLDPRDLNKAVQRPHYPLPTLEEVATRLTGAKVFSVLDAKSGFWQVKLDEESSYLTTFNTPFGRFRWLRMPFGINSAPEEWQRRANTIADGLKGVEVIADDFLLVGYGKTVAEATQDHDKNLTAFLERARRFSLTLNAEKVQLRLQQVPFIGHLLTPNGLAVDPAKVEAITKMPPPADLKALKRLLGMVNYLAKFLPHLSTICEPLRQLEHHDVEWCWLEQHSSALERVKSLITAAPVLAYYDVTRPVTIQCDASEAGLGAALLQDDKPVVYASRALTQAERNYAQIEKELLAIVYACEKFDQYVYARQITVQSDHKPLESITKKPIHAAPKRLQRMLLRLQRYDLDVTYKKGTEMLIADTLSRAYLPFSQGNATDNAFLVELADINMAQDVPVSHPLMKDISEASLQDAELRAVAQLTRDGWPNNRSSVPHPARPYFNFRDELSIQGPLLFKGQCVVVPYSLRAPMMDKLHSSHLGSEGCLRRAREVFYWPGMNQEVKDFISACNVCNTFKPEQCREPLQPHEIPTRPWSRVGVDLFQLGDKHYMITVDYFSNLSEVDHLSTTTSMQVINKLRIHFARYGIPDTVVSDNGPQFSSDQFAAFAKQWQFTHVTSSPRYAQSNGKAENAVKTVKMIMKKAIEAKSDVYLALLDFRNTPSESMHSSPAQRMFGRRTRTLLPLSPSLLQPDPVSLTMAPKQLRKSKAKQAQQYDRKSKALSQLLPGNIVRMKTPGDTSGRCSSRWTLARVIKPVGPRSYLVECQGSTFRRNRRQLRTTPEQYQTPPEPEEPFEALGREQPAAKPRDTADTESCATRAPPVSPLDAPAAPEDAPSETPPVEATVRRSGRTRTMPARYKDFHMY